MYLRVIKILLFAIYCSFTLGAENVNYPSQKIETFVSEQGFFQNSVNDITTDKYGFLWVATPNGLVRYDGYAFEYVYHNAFDSTSIPDNYISQLLKDDNGNLWINTRHGLCFYESSKEVFTPCQCDLFNIKIMKADAKNRVWIVKGRALHIFESVNDENYPIHKIGCINLGDELKKQFIIDIEFLSESELLIATSSNVFLLNIDESNLLEADISSLRFKNEGARIIKIIKKKNLIWVGTNDGLFQTLYQGKHLKTLDRFFVSEEGKVPLRVTKMFVDAEDKLWIGTRGHGILVYNNAGFSAFKHDPKQKDGLTSNRINSFYEDDFGIMWVGTAQGGINKIDRTKKNFYNYSHNPYDDESLASNLVTDIIEGADGRIWMSSFDNSVCRTSDSFEALDVNDIKFESIDKLHDALHNKCVVCIYQDTKLNWWIVTENGLYLYNERTDKLKKLQLVFNGVDLDVSSSRVVTQNVHGQIIIGGRQLYQLDNPWSAIAQNKPIVVSESFFNIGENNHVFVYTKDSFGNHWLGTRLGLYQLDYSDGQWEEKNFFSIKENNQKLKLSHRYIFS